MYDTDYFRALIRFCVIYHTSRVMQFDDFIKFCKK